MTSKQSEEARKQWEKENNVQTLKIDEIYNYDEEEYNRIVKEAPWKHDNHYFKQVKISAVALLKMVMHANSGGRIEVMGVMQGRVDHETFIIMDAFALPVEATEVRVNAGAEADEYLIKFMTMGKKVGRTENTIGWYHSHPGYGCWLSGIDVGTQMQNQQFQDPWLAIVIDPIRTSVSGQVQIGAFRTYPKDYKPEDEGSNEYQTIPLDKIEDFGVHCKRYYQLDITIFKSSLDSKLLELLWNKYWVSTLSTSPSLTNEEFTNNQINDLGKKIVQIEGSLSQSIAFAQENQKEESQLSKLAKDSSKVGIEHVNSSITQVVKHTLFNIKV